VATDTRTQDIGINLLPQEVATVQRTNRIFRLVVLAAIVIVGLLIVITVIQRIRIAGAERDLQTAEARRDQLRTQVEALREFELLKQSNDANRASLAAALVGDVNWTLFLDKIDENIPSDSWLSSLSVQSGTATTPLGEPVVGSVTFGANVRTFPGLANWLDVMGEIEGFKFVYFSSGTRGESGVTFGATSSVGSELLSHRCETETSPCP
jgi:Tfp pilus assembly protein PilN